MHRLMQSYRCDDVRGRSLGCSRGIRASAWPCLRNHGDGDGDGDEEVGRKEEPDR
jgi:hypothetical protein